MRALFAGGGEAPQFREIDVPVLTRSEQAIVRPLAVALCDLDVPYIMNRLPSAAPFALGHEFVAEVVAVGDGVANWRPGDRVIVPFQISCGSCQRCGSRRSLDCDSVPPLSTFGLAPFGGGDWGGAIADFVLVPFADAMLIALPQDAKPADYASVSDNVADGYRCVAPHCGPTDTLLILGSASVGLYAAATAKALGVDCTYVDTDPARLGVAQALGVKAVDEAAAGQAFGEFAVTACCASSSEALLSALASTAPGGTCQSAGIHFQPFALPLFEMYRRGVRFVTGRANARDDIPAVLDLISTGALDVASINAQVVPVGDVLTTLSGPLPHKTIIDMDG